MNWRPEYPHRHNLDDVKCLHCGNIGLTSTNHCKKCYGDHKVVID